MEEKDKLLIAYFIKEGNAKEADDQIEAGDDEMGSGAEEVVIEQDKGLAT